MHIFRDVVLLAATLAIGVAASSQTTTIAVPSPLSVPPSQYWDGDDGQWSSFFIRVGQPAQSVRVLASTNCPESIVVSPLGCSTQAQDPVPSDCAKTRGGEFNSTLSQTWRDQGIFALNSDGVGFEANLGYSAHMDYGLETLGLGTTPDGPTLKNQTVSVIATTSPLYMGLLGLGTQPVNYSNIGNYSAPSFFTTLRQQSSIPSLSWSYTAGAIYQLKNGQPAQLIFGGYDTSRFTANSISFTLAPDVDRDIVVAIQSITYRGTTQANLLATPIYAFIESTDPNIWLPEAACQQFESAFGISIDNATGLYLINSTQYSDLMAADPEVTFSIANSLSGGQTVNIVLPFSAFALKAKYPFIPSNATSPYYFPLRQAANETQYTLGRTFLQEAYLTVDYESGNFSVSQCLWNAGTTSTIVPIISSSYASANNTSPSSKNSSATKSGLGSGAIAGIAVGVVAILGVIAAAAFFLYRRKIKRPSSKVPTEDIVLTNVNKDKDGESLLSPGTTPAAPMYSKFGNHHPLDHELVSTTPHTELPTGHEEPHEVPTGPHEDQDYATAASAMRAERTPEVEGSNALYELHGDMPEASELDDESSRATFSPRSPLTASNSQRTVSTSHRSPTEPYGSPRLLTSPMSPMSGLSLSPFSERSDRSERSDGRF